MKTKEKYVGDKSFKVFPDKGVVRGRVFCQSISSEINGCSKDIEKIILHTIYLLGIDDDYPKYISCFSKCDDRDEFDEKKGIDLVGEKLDRKKHHKAANRFRRLYLLFLECAAFCMAKYEFHDKKIKRINEDIVRTYGTEGE